MSKGVSGEVSLTRGFAHAQMNRRSLLRGQSSERERSGKWLRLEEEQEEVKKKDRQVSWLCAGPLVDSFLSSSRFHSHTSRTEGEEEEQR